MHGMTDAIEPNYFRDLLMPVCEPLHSFLEDSGAVADGHFKDHGLPVKLWWGRTHLIRAHLAHRLEAATLEGFELKDTSNNGRLELHAPDGSTVRILHLGPGATVPPPGRSHARVRYYRQQQLQIPGMQASRLIALWLVDLQGFASVRVVRPIGRWKYGQKAKVDVDMTLPRTAAALADLEFVPEDQGLELRLPANDVVSDSLDPRGLDGLATPSIPDDA